VILEAHMGTARVLRANGQRASCKVEVSELDSAFTATRPAKVVLPPPVKPSVHEVAMLWNDEEFLPYAGANPRIAKYKQQKAKASACFDKAWDKLDPDGVASKYDVVSLENGHVKKVEGLADRLQRKVDAQCGLGKLMTERAAIRKALEKTAITEAAARLARVRDRFAPPT